MANDTLKARQRRIARFWIATALVVVAVIAWGLWPRAIEADFAIIDVADVRLQLVDEGRTRMHEVYTVSAPVAGRVLRVDVEPGDVVTQGAIIARMTQAPAGFLDTRSDMAARAGIAASAAGLRAAETDLTLARQEQVRTAALAGQKLVALAAVDASQARLDAAQAARDAAAADLARARSALQPADRAGSAGVTIRAPAAGRVLTVPQKSEGVVQVGSPLIEIGDPSHIEVVAEFLSQDAVRMHAGAMAQIENWGGAPLPARVDRIEPVARLKISALGVEEQRANVILQFTDSAAAAALGHDYRVDARVTVDEALQAVRAPLGALFRHGEGWAVYRVIDGRARLAPVSAGIADSSYRAISEGLAAGDVVVLFPGDSIREGLRVRARPR
ncbi:MAG: efflux RND transporter periplasmic adaptor subunit [Steroidobacteraceae bacterium]